MAALRPTYLVRRALDGMARRPRLALTAAVTVAVAVLVTGLFTGALRAAARLVADWAGEVRITVYLDPAVDLATARAAAAEVAAGRTVEAVTAEDALRRFREALGPDRALIEGVPAGVLPPSVEVRAPGIALEEARALALRLQTVPGAREVDYGGAWLEPLEAAVRRARRAGLALLVALAAGAAALVANTLRLGVLARRDEIGIMKLVGATDAFVALPFLLEGLLEGVAGGAAAAAALRLLGGAALHRVSAALALQRPLTAAEVLPGGVLAALVAGGAALGLAASALAVGAELRRRD